MSRLAASIGLAFALALGLGSREVAAQAQPDGQLTVAFDVAPMSQDACRDISFDVVVTAS